MKHLAFLLLTTTFTLTACTHAPVTPMSVPAVQSIQAQTYDMGATTGGSLVIEAPGARQVLAFTQEIKRYELVLKCRGEVVLQGITLTPQDGQQTLSILNVPPGTYTLHITAINLADQPVQYGAPEPFQAEAIEVKASQVSYASVSVPLMETPVVPWGIFKPTPPRPLGRSIAPVSEPEAQDPLSNQNQADGDTPAAGDEPEATQPEQPTATEESQAEQQAPADEKPEDNTQVNEPGPAEQDAKTEEGNS